VIIDLSSQSFVVLGIQNLRASSVSVLISLTHLHVGLHLESIPPSTSTFGPNTAFALHSSIGLGFSRLAPVNNLLFPNPTKTRLVQQIYKKSTKRSNAPRTVADGHLPHPTTQLPRVVSPLVFRRGNYASRQTLSKSSPFSLLRLGLSFRPTTCFW
jgi:hypothetical protein